MRSGNEIKYKYTEKTTVVKNSDYILENNKNVLAFSKTFLIPFNYKEGQYNFTKRCFLVSFTEISFAF